MEYRESSPEMASDPILGLLNVSFAHHICVHRLPSLCARLPEARACLFVSPRAISGAQPFQTLTVRGDSVPPDARTTSVAERSGTEGRRACREATAHHIKRGKRERQAFLRRAAMYLRRAVHSGAKLSAERLGDSDGFDRCSLRIVSLPR